MELCKKNVPLLEWLKNEINKMEYYNELLLIMKERN